MELVENLVKSIPWGHNQRIMYKYQNIEEALFYAQKQGDDLKGKGAFIAGVSLADRPPSA